MKQLVFNIDNQRDDYLPLYPQLRQSIFTRDRMTIGLGILLIVCVLFSLILSFKSPATPREYGLAWIATIVVFIGLIIKLLEALKSKQQASKFVDHVVRKGPAEITVDFVGIEFKFQKEINLFEFEHNGQIHLEQTHLMIMDRYGKMVAIVPRGEISEERWLEIQEGIAAIIKAAASKRLGLED